LPGSDLSRSTGESGFNLPIPAAALTGLVVVTGARLLTATAFCIGKGDFPLPFAIRTLVGKS